ncbi:MAG: hypothetical protein RIQ63_637 [Actinomycetota bacterium]|jgi:branched-subunit amino acid transport protein|nr:AzlD domain-containing protein [Actinomycetota bacterium]NBT37084.1 AzlD domain-containing protein [Actinomycetota bacterium]NBY13062.1 AzlD domain-containing protein [Actinomycetota bacterium]NCZ92327.1 AzlD domain-containing protein [Actinomycetota bacterium]NCZ93057.1 AzlD domain-containing protein [Actinomycetota bacterium]
MSWWVVVWLSLGAYAFKVLGFVVIGSRKLPRALERCLLLIPAALLAALVVKDTFSTQQSLVVDERALGLAVALLCVWKKRSLVVTIVAAAAATAILRAL